MKTGRSDLLKIEEANGKRNFESLTLLSDYECKYNNEYDKCDIPIMTRV